MPPPFLHINRAIDNLKYRFILTSDATVIAYFGGRPLPGRGASGVLYFVLDTTLLPWTLLPDFIEGLCCFGVSGIPKICDFVLPLLALCGRCLPFPL